MLHLFKCWLVGLSFLICVATALIILAGLVHFFVWVSGEGPSWLRWLLGIMAFVALTMLVGLLVCA